MIIDDVKTLLEIKDDSKDGILNIYIQRASTLVLKYLNNDFFNIAYIQENFPEAIVELTYNAYLLRGNENFVQKSEGSMSVTFKENFGMIIDSVVNLLPLPYAKLR